MVLKCEVFKILFSYVVHELITSRGTKHNMDLNYSKGVSFLEKHEC